MDVNNKTVDVKIVSNAYGAAGNFTIASASFNGTDKLEDLVGAQGTVTVGGAIVFPAGTPDIVVAGGDEYEAVSHGTIIKQLKKSSIC